MEGRTGKFLKILEGPLLIMWNGGSISSSFPLEWYLMAGNQEAFNFYLRDDKEC